MTTTDQLIALAETIAKGLRGVSRNEWMRWIQVAQQHGIDKALHYAHQLAYDPTVRPAQKRAYRLIVETLQRFRSQIVQLQEDEAHKLYGFIAWELVIQKQWL